MLMNPLRINTPHCSFTPPHRLGYLSCLNQNNQNNAGTYSTNHGQPLPACGYFKLSVGYWPHANLQRAEVKEWLINEVEHEDNPNETYFFSVGFLNLVLKTILYLHSLEWSERLGTGMIM